MQSKNLKAGQTQGKVKTLMNLFDIKEEDKNDVDEHQNVRPGCLDDLQGALEDSLGLKDVIKSIEGTTGDGENEIGLQGLVDPLVMKAIPEQAQVLTSYIINKALYHLLTDVLEISAGVGLSWNATSITLAQMKQKLEELQKDVNTLLEADYKAALNWLKFVSNELEEEQYSLAYENLQKVLELSIRGYSQVKDFKKKVFCKKLTIYALRMTRSYKKDSQTFVDVSELKDKEQKSLAKNVFAELEELIKDFEKLKPSVSKKVFWKAKKAKDKVVNPIDAKMNSYSPKKKQEKVLDSILKMALPIIWHHIDIFKTEEFTSSEMLKYVPKGHENCCDIVLEGKWPIRLWKITLDDKLAGLQYEFQDRHDEDLEITKSSFISISSISKYFSVIG